MSYVTPPSTTVIIVETAGPVVRWLAYGALIAGTIIGLILVGWRT